MRTVRIQALKNQALIADKCHVAESFVSRFMGLMGKSGLEAGEGIWLRPCNSIHMWFMRFPIDVVFVSPRQGRDGSTILEVRCAPRGGAVAALSHLGSWRARHVGAPCRDDPKALDHDGG